jgi:hypothetical protein
MLGHVYFVLHSGPLILYLRQLGELLIYLKLLLKLQLLMHLNLLLSPASLG